MSYELDNLKREVDILKWQKAENYKLESLETTVRHLAETLMKATNIISRLEERLNVVEGKVSDIPFNGED